LPLYAGLQMEMAAHTEDLLAAGAFDRRLERLPGLLEQLLDDRGALRLGMKDGLSPQEHRRLQELLPTFAADCAALAKFGIPETLQHDDFHDGNILVAQGRYIFFDWAESAVAHPFFTLVVTLRSIAYSLGMGEEAVGLQKLRDIYLEAWTRYGSRAELRAAFALADRVGRINRALTWYQVVAEIAAVSREEYGEAVPGWLQEYLAKKEMDRKAKSRLWPVGVTDPAKTSIPHRD
jgi:Ser/Thr protein kinase RdoA (MazF antagonist)